MMKVSELMIISFENIVRSPYNSNLHEPFEAFKILTSAYNNALAAREKNSGANRVKLGL